MNYTKYRIKITVWIEDLGERECTVVAKRYNDDPEYLWWVNDYGLDSVARLDEHPEAIKLN